MKATLRSVRIAPKKARVVAALVRGKSVADAQRTLARTNKKAARLLEKLIQSAVANAVTNDGQDAAKLKIKLLNVNQAQAYHRGIPMSRGRVRSIRKFLSHIDVVLGVEGVDEGVSASKKDAEDAKESKDVKDAKKKGVEGEKGAKGATKKKPVTRKTKTSSDSSASSASSKKKSSPKKKPSTPKSSS